MEPSSVPGVTPKPTSAGRKLLRVATRCTSLDEFLATFSRFVDDTSVTIITSQPRAVGTKQPFAIQLKDGETVMRGECEIIEASSRAAGTRPSMRLKLVDMDETTRALHKELLSRAKRGTLLGIPAMRPSPPPIPSDAKADKGAASTGVPAKVDDGWDSAPTESRTPGASYTLPANPLGELPDEALEYFVECTLYEETGLHPLNEILAQGESAGANAGNAGVSTPTVQIAPTAAPLPPPAFVPASTPPRPATPIPVSASPAAPTLSIPPLPAPEGEDVDLSGYLGAASRAQTVPAQEGGGRLLERNGEASSASRMDGQFTMPVERLPRRRSWLLPAFVIGVFAGGIGFVGGYLGRGHRGSQDASATTPPAPSAAGPATTPPAAIPSTAAAATGGTTAPPNAGSPGATTPASGEPTPGAGDPDPGDDSAGAAPPPKGTCIATVSSEPPEAPVYWNKKHLGETPLSDIEIPCGAGKIIINHPRYETVERAVNALPDHRVAVAERLIRPAGMVALESSPPGASFTVDGKSVGKSAPVLAFTHIKVSAKLAGYKPWAEDVYVKGRKMTVSAKLEAIAKKPPTPPRRPGTK